MPTINSSNNENDVTEFLRLKKENERLKAHLLQVDAEFEESLSDLKNETDYLREENIKLKELLERNTEAERLRQAMAEMERGYEKQIHSLQETLRKIVQESQKAKPAKEITKQDDFVEKSILKGLLQVLLDRNQRSDAQEQALKMLCELSGLPVRPGNGSSRKQSTDEPREQLERVGLGDLWIAYLNEKTK